MAARSGYTEKLDKQNNAGVVGGVVARLSGRTESTSNDVNGSGSNAG